MAKIVGKFKKVKLRGRLSDDLIVYPWLESNVLRRKSEIPKERYREDPVYDQFRKNQTEFGLASSLGKTLRDSIWPYYQIWRKGNGSNNLTGLLRKCIGKGYGEFGKRNFEFSKLGISEEDFLNKEQVLLGKSKPFRFNRAEAGLSVRMTYGKLRKLFGKAELPQKIVLGIIALSEIEHQGCYQILHPTWHGQSVFKESKIIRHWPEKGELRIKVRFKGNGRLPENVGLIGVMGVVGI